MVHPGRTKGQPLRNAYSNLAREFYEVEIQLPEASEQSRTRPQKIPEEEALAPQEAWVVSSMLALEASEIMSRLTYQIVTRA
jgi:hypothetical protein